MLRDTHKGREIVVKRVQVPGQAVGSRRPPPGTGWKITWGGVDVTGRVVRSGTWTEQTLMDRAKEVL
ncbi:hypothetical protein [Deinococcus yavapaiensis]|uniref:Uncharacterized protein n=1 Tax=Deinococcus yavapaiensis KR-236 TaxID=694435 RepID=A0A318S0B1_9DEIO|nr:hypothetical protein [Deinococcus yavapaiensis]PYE50005.1 hypothetical protein DES52_11925 [Deinococcus yavapaiensis KR-236]